MDSVAAEGPDGVLTLRRWVGRYELIHRLAHGGMATVYLGRAKGKAGFEKVVAVKIIHPHLANEAEFVGMFLDEARIAARIHHPHVVEILDLGEDDGLYYMVMEFIEGENLAALVRALKGERLPIPVILQLLADTLEGLGAAHELEDADGRPFQLVHRDVSPHNILINLDGWAKVGDFGIMKAAGKTSNTRTGELRGKLAYMSPEQARGGRIDHRTDLFAVGVIAWELLTGQRLFACTTEAATLEKVIACEVPSLAGFVGSSEQKADRPELTDQPELLAGLQAWLDRSLAAKPEQRFESAAQMLSELRRLSRLALDLREDGPSRGLEPRAVLGNAMARFFRTRVDYARAALRRTGELDTFASLARGGAIDPTLARAPSDPGQRVAAEPGELRNHTPAPELAGQGRERDQTVPLARSPTGSNPAVSFAGLPGTAEPTGSSPTITVVQQGNRFAQWSLMLLLPMIGAAIAVVAMAVLEPLVREREAGERAEPSELAPAAPAEPVPSLAASEAASKISPASVREPGSMVRWCFSTTPGGATVRIAGVEQAEMTPTCAHVAAGDEPLAVELELAGYESLHLDLTPVADQNFPERLVPLDADAPPRTRSRKAKTGSKAGKPGLQISPPRTGSDKPKKFIPVPDSLLTEDEG